MTYPSWDVPAADGRWPGRPAVRGDSPLHAAAEFDLPTDLEDEDFDDDDDEEDDLDMLQGGPEFEGR